MLDDKIFEAGMKLLQENYEHINPKPLSKSIQGIWRQYLDEHLSDEEFTAAIKYFILHSRYRPTASELVDHIHGGKEVKALQEWGMIVDAAGKNTEEKLVYLTDRAKIALKAIGGVEAVGWANSIDRQRLEKKFVSIYCQCSSEDRKALAQSAQQATDQTPRETMHDMSEQEHNALERKRRWEEKNSNN